MDPRQQIEELRKKINEIDQKIVELLNERAELAREIISIKQENDIPLYDPRREEEIFENVRSSNKGPLYHEAVVDIYETILKWMKSLTSEE